jgi:hypothetical protein
MLALPTGGPPSHIVPSPHHSSDGGSDDDDDDDDDDDFAAQLRRDLEAANSGQFCSFYLPSLIPDRPCLLRYRVETQKTVSYRPSRRLLCG